MKKAFIYALSAAFWLLLWQGLFVLIGKEILIPSPLSVFERLFELCLTSKFWVAVGTSLFRVLTGLFLGTLLGTFTAVLTAKSPVLRALFEPALHVIKATPVASFIILAILWLSVENVPAFTSMLIVLPAVWANVEKGILSVDPMLTEMGKSFGLSKSEVFFRITVPSVKPFFSAAMTSAVGMAWKAGIAAEVICPYRDSMGSALHDSKIYFETVDTFAWTAAVIVLSVVFEKLILTLAAKGGRRHA